jgi:hypothetical protein
VSLFSIESDYVTHYVRYYCTRYPEVPAVEIIVMIAVKFDYVLRRRRRFRIA